MEDPKDGSTEYNGPDVGGHRNDPSMVMGFGNGVPSMLLSMTKMLRETLLGIVSFRWVHSGDMILSSQTLRMVKIQIAAP